MTKRELWDDILESPKDLTLGEMVELLSRLNVGEYCERVFLTKDTVPMNEYIKGLKQEGLDIGKGEAKFGYKMPLPEKDVTRRYLRIFRRR